MSLTIDTSTFTRFEKSPTTQYLLFDADEFKEKYTDPQLFFFNSLFPEVRDLLIKSIFILENAILEDDRNEWQTAIFALRSIANTMLFIKLEKYKINTFYPNIEDFQTLKRCIHDTFTVILKNLPEKKIKKKKFASWKQWIFGNSKILAKN